MDAKVVAYSEYEKVAVQAETQLSTFQGMQWNVKNVKNEICTVVDIEMLNKVAQRAVISFPALVFDPLASLHYSR